MRPDPTMIIVASMFTIGAVTWLLTPIVRGLGEQQRHELSEAIERLDFAERLLARGREVAPPEH